MPQFDVHRNPGRTRAVIPFVLVAQGDRWKDRADRVVVPLVLASEVGYRDPTLNPDFTIDGTAVIPNPLQMATIPLRVLGPAVGSLDGAHIRVIAALDAGTNVRYGGVGSRHRRRFPVLRPPPRLGAAAKPDSSDQKPVPHEARPHR